MKMKNVPLLIAGIFGALLAFIAFNGGDMIFFALTNAWNGQWTPPDSSKCTAPDFEEFSAKLIETPRVTVTSFEQCMEYGEAMNHPLICKIDAELSNSEKIIENILSDDTIYNTMCKDRGGDFHYGTGRVEKNQTIADVVSAPSDCGAGFIYGSKHQALLKAAIPSLDEEFETKDFKRLVMKKGNSGIMMGTSFISNYMENRISTGSHAAMCVSMAVQLVGTKRWILHSHEESGSKYWYKTVWTLFPTCVADFMKNLKKPYIAVTGPGDILYFPIAYQHLVYTEQGVNVMTNIRKVRLPKITDFLSTFSTKSIVMMLVVKIFAGMDKANNPRETSYSPMLDFMAKCKNSVDPKEVGYIKSFSRFIEQY